MNPYGTVEPPPGRSGTNRLVRAGALVLVPPVAAVWLWRSPRLRTLTKVVLTGWCVLATFLWIGILTSPAPKKSPSHPVETTPTPNPSASGPIATTEPASTPPPRPSATSGLVPAPTEAPDTTPATPTGPPSPADPVTPAEPSEATTSAAPATEAPSAYYRRCADARAAGAAPLHRGEPGYRSELDRDGDGVACEPWP
ncbi:excalibur calcium-binding domain-containing protein [Streptomyces sp. NPDC054797]